MMNKKIIVFIIYVVLGFVLALTDPFVLPVYLTILPFQSFLLYESVKTKNIFFILFSFMTFLSYGIGSVAFYLDRKNANSVGFDAIGNFDFSYSSLFSAYSYFVVFVISLWFFVSVFKKKQHSNFLSGFIKEQYKVITSRSSSLSLFPISLLVVLFSAISIWMYSFHIGMIGLHQTELPFHLTGILFYSRRFLFPLVLVWVFVKTKSKDVATILLIIYSLIVGVLATSKSAALFVLLPLAYLNYMMGRKKLFYICTVAAIIVYVIVGGVRTVIYETDADVDILALFSTSYDFYSADRGLVLTVVKSVTGRLYGLQSTILGNQYDHMTIDGLLSFYTGSGITTVVPDYVQSLFGFELPEDKAYGVALGYSGTMHILACHSYLLTILQAFIVSIIFCVQNNSVQMVFRREGLTKYKYVLLILLLFSFMKLYEGIEMVTVYVCLFAIVIIKQFALKTEKKRSGSMFSMQNSITL